MQTTLCTFSSGYAPSGTVDLDFTGQTQDTVSGLYDFLFGEYSANQGRWPWPDPAGMRAVDPANPQTWNRYAYVGNMPLNSVDHLGLLSWMSDAGPYIRAMARTSAFFSTFEFFPIITDGHDREQTGFLGFVGPGGGGFSPPAKNRFRKRRLPKNAKTCSAMGLQFYAPPGFDLSQIVRAGQNGGLLGINAAVGQGGTFDVQRETSILASTTTFYSGYTQAANIAVGAYEYGAGLSPAGANFLANAYADVMSSNACDPELTLYQNFGYDLAAAGWSPSCH